MSQLSSEAGIRRLLLPPAFVLFRPPVDGIMPTTQGRAVLFTEPPGSNASLIWKHLTDTPRKKV